MHFHLDKLEKRILFSADSAIVASVSVEDSTDSIQIVSEQNLTSGSVAKNESESESTPKLVIVVDAAVPNYQAVIADLKLHNNSIVDLIVLDNQVKFPFLVIGTALEKHNHVTALHIISHGANGALNLAEKKIDTMSLLANATVLSDWKNHFSSDADILIYGCEVAQDDTGRAFIDTLARLTGTDVSGSSNLTGAERKGGDWDFEYSHGEVDNEIALSTSFRESFNSSLATETRTVKNTNDSGTGSLRQALTGLSATNTVINFSVDGTITLASALPDISKPVTINGISAPGYTSAPVVKLDGTNAGSGVNGLKLVAGSDGSTINGLQITNFTDTGIYLNNSDGNTIELNYLGTDGSTRMGNDIGGITLHFSANNQIGSPGKSNVISGNGFAGIFLEGNDSTGNKVQSNFIGTNAAGDLSVKNATYGIEITVAHGNQIGGSISANEGNLISGNSSKGINILRADNTVIKGNYIGVDISGLNKVGNLGSGINIEGATGTMIGGSSSDDRNVISGNTSSGLHIYQSSDTQVYGNYIGTSANGTSAIENSRGVFITDSNTTYVGSENTGTGNVISGNDLDGIYIVNGATNNSVKNNLIGTDKTSNSPIPNNYGVRIVGGSTNNIIGGMTSSESNIIKYNIENGIAVTGSSTNQNAFLLNEISENSQLGIDLGLDGVTLNDTTDSDTGPNDMINTPIISSVDIISASVIHVTGTIDTTANTYYRIDFYALANQDSTKYGEADRHLGTLSGMSDNTGTGSFDTDISASVNNGEFVTATLTSTTTAWASLLNTSEFSKNVAAATGNNAPTALALSNNSVSENTNTSSGSTIGTLSTTDPDSGDTFTYSVFSGPDFSAFSIGGTSSNELILTDGTLDYESQSSYAVTVRTTDSGGLFFDQALTINVTDLNESPTALSLSNNAVSENTDTSSGTSIGTLSTTDADSGETFTYSVVASGPDFSVFSIGGTSSNELILTNGTLDYESQSSYAVTVRTTDSGGLFFDQALTINVTDLNESPTALSLSNNTISENTDTSSGTSIGTLSTTDADSGETFTYSVVASGPDFSVFSIGGTSSNELFLTDGTLDFETQSSYAVTVRTTDSGGLTFDQALTINVTNLNESPTALSSSNNTIAENTDTSGGTSIGTLSTTDVDAGDTFIYSIIGGTDASVFSMGGASSNELILIDGVLDYETQSSYAVTVRTTDSGGLTFDQAFTVNITDQNEHPTALSLSNNTITENTDTSNGISIGILSTTDADLGETFIYNIIGGADAALFSIGGTKQNELLIENDILDFEKQSEFTIRISVTDSGNLTYVSNFIVNVLDANEAPIAKPDTLSTTNTSVLEINPVSMLLANDVDPENSPLKLVGFSQPGHGKLTINEEGTLEYTPDAGFTGEDSFEYTVADDAGNRISAVAVLSITAANTPELAAAIEQGVSANDSKELSIQTMTDSAEAQDETGTEEMDTTATNLQNSLPHDLLYTDPNAQTVSMLEHQEQLEFRVALLTDNYSIAPVVNRISLINAQDDVATVVDTIIIDLYAPVQLEELRIAITSMLDALNEQTEETIKDEVQTARAITFSGVTLTVGIATWTLRSNVLLAMATLTAPLWRSADPIPILAQYLSGTGKLTEAEGNRDNSDSTLPQ